MAQFCPICGKEVPASERYPRAVCGECGVRASDEKGRRLTFGNESFSGGFVASYADTGEPREGANCWIDGIPCLAGEARFGGIVIQVAS